MLRYDNASEELFAANLSEGGIFIRKADPLNTGTDVEITLPLHDEKTITLKGTVVYKKIIYGEEFTIGPGMGIEFKDITKSDAAILRDYIIKLLSSEIM